MSRSGAAIFLLMASLGGPAFAMDPSATEETNCLMACDANQEHCAASPHASVPKNYSPAEHLSLPKTKSSAIFRSRRTIAGR